jgi:hypothetical protein
MRSFLFSKRVEPRADIVRLSGGKFNLKIVNYDSAPIELIGLTDADGAKVAEKTFPVKIANNSIQEIEFTPTKLINTDGLILNFRYYYKDGENSILVKKNDFSFYAVGHFYGSVGADTEHPHPPFVKYAPKIANNKRLDFGVIMGDLVVSPSEESYKDVLSALKTTKKAYYAIPGNHDDGDGGELFNKFFRVSFSYFVRNDNLFLLLDSQKEENGIPDEQLDAIRQALLENPNVKNIFVFTHELIWLDAANPVFSGFEPNSRAAYSEEMPNRFNFTLLPLLKNTGASLYYIA